MRIERYLGIAFVVATLAYLPVLYNLQYIGEESVYSLMSYEMNFNQSWMVATLYDEPYWRPPLFNWLIIFGSKAIGWNKSLEVARFISITSSILCAISVYWFSKNINLKLSTSLGNALIFITCWQISFNYGWLAYSDALLNFLTTLGIFLAILSAKTSKTSYLYCSIAVAFLAVLTKAVTGYFHITVALIIASYFYKNLAFLVKAKVLLSHILFGLLFYSWNKLSPTGEITSLGAASDITQKFNGFLSITYPLHLLELALTLFANFLPWSLIFLWFFIRDRKKLKTSIVSQDFLVLITVAISIFLPYWIAPHGHSRYLLPVYAPLSILFGAYLNHLKIGLLIIPTSICMIALKVIYLTILFPTYVTNYRPNISAIAQDIYSITNNYPIYANDGGWVGIAVTDTINRHNSNNIIRLYTNSVTDAFVISHVGEPQVGQLIKDYGKIRLLCVGKACSKSH